MIKVVKGEFQHYACVSIRRHLEFLNYKHYLVGAQTLSSKDFNFKVFKGWHKEVILISEFQQLIFKVVEIKNVL